MFLFLFVSPWSGSARSVGECNTLITPGGRPPRRIKAATSSRKWVPIRLAMCAQCARGSSRKEIAPLSLRSHSVAYQGDRISHRSFTITPGISGMTRDMAYGPVWPISTFTTSATVAYLCVLARMRDVLLATTSNLLRHTSSTMTLHYVHLSLNHRASALRALHYQNASAHEHINGEGGTFIAPLTAPPCRV
jgi:hypothetical protein